MANFVYCCSHELVNLISLVGFVVDYASAIFSGMIEARWGHRVHLSNSASSGNGLMLQDE